MKVENITVYSERWVYAGWPANHGSWQWDNEMLFGFVRGEYDKRAHMHHVNGELEFVQARSKDYGETWVVETTGIDEAFSLTNKPPKFDMIHEDTILRVRGNYDHGGDYVAKEGGFYLSEDRGGNWAGPYRFHGLEFPPGFHNTSRTCVVGDLVYLSSARTNIWGSDGVFVANYDGQVFHDLGECVSYEYSRAVMPAVVTLNGKYHMVCRRKEGRKCWIDSYVSNNGLDWEFGSYVSNTGKSNGNPPALVEVNGTLICAYANRTKKAILFKTSKNGVDWSKEVELYRAESSDMGYPRLFYTEKGFFVVFYSEGDDRSSILGVNVDLEAKC